MIRVFVELTLINLLETKYMIYISNNELSNLNFKEIQPLS